MEAKRIEFKYKKIYYKNELSERILVFLAHDHATQLIK